MVGLEPTVENGLDLAGLQQLDGLVALCGQVAPSQLGEDLVLVVGDARDHQVHMRRQTLGRQPQRQVGACLVRRTGGG